MRELWFCYVDLSLKCVVLLLRVTMLIICFWWRLFIITPSYLFIILVCLSVYLLSCMYVLLLFSQKFFEWETFPQIKFGDAVYLCGSILLTWRVQAFLLFIILFKLNALNSFPFRLFPLAWSCHIYENYHLRTCPVFVFSTHSTWIPSYCFFCDPAAQIVPRTSHCWGF